MTNFHKHTIGSTDNKLSLNVHVPLQYFLM